MTGPERRADEDDWCDWCALPIPLGQRRRADSRVFCTDRCVAAFRAGADAPTVVELPVEGGPHES